MTIESSTFSPLPSTLADITILRGDELLARSPFMPGWCFQQDDDPRADVTWLPRLHGRPIDGGAMTGEAHTSRDIASATPSARSWAPSDEPF